MTAAPETFWNRNMKKVMTLPVSCHPFGAASGKLNRRERPWQNGKDTCNLCRMCLMASSLNAPDKYALIPVLPWLISSSSSSLALVMPTSSWIYR